MDQNGNGIIDGNEWSATISVVAGMTYGTPPVETLAGNITTTDPGDLRSHGIFETYFREFSFNFNNELQIKVYDAQTSTSAHKELSEAGSGGMYFMPFLVDLSDLKSTESIHFDLYSEALAKKTTTDLGIDQFAPFSHDAEGKGLDDGKLLRPQSIPDGGTTVLLLGAAMCSGEALRRKFNRG